MSDDRLKRLAAGLKDVTDARNKAAQEELRRREEDIRQKTEWRELFEKARKWLKFEIVAVNTELDETGYQLRPVTEPTEHRSRFLGEAGAELVAGGTRQTRVANGTCQLTPDGRVSTTIHSAPGAEDTAKSHVLCRIEDLDRSHWHDWLVDIVESGLKAERKRDAPAKRTAAADTED